MGCGASNSNSTTAKQEEKKAEEPIEVEAERKFKAHVQAKLPQVHTAGDEKVEDLFQVVKVFLLGPRDKMYTRGLTAQEEENLFSEAILRTHHQQMVRLAADTRGVPDEMIDSMWQEVKEGRFKHRPPPELATTNPEDETLEQSKNTSETASNTTSATVGDVQLQELPISLTQSEGTKNSMKSNFYRMAAQHLRDDPYYKPQQLDQEFVPDPNSKIRMKSTFVAVNHFQRITVRDNNDYTQPAVYDPMHQNTARSETDTTAAPNSPGGKFFPVVVPDHWDTFRTAFSEVASFTKWFATVLPPSYPAGCETDVQKIEYILGLFGTNRIKNMVENWSQVKADVFVVPKPGKANVPRFQPAFAGMFCWYETPTSTYPLLYTIVGSDGAGTCGELYTNKISTPEETEESIRFLQSPVGFKFTPLTSAKNWYSHAMKLYDDHAIFYIDAYYHALPPPWYYLSDLPAASKSEATSEQVQHEEGQGQAPPPPASEEKPPEPTPSSGPNERYLRVAVHIKKEESSNPEKWYDAVPVLGTVQRSRQFNEATLVKGFLGQNLMSPYYPDKPEYQVMKLVLTNGEQPSTSAENMKMSLGGALAEFLDTMFYSPEELGFTIRPHLQSKATGERLNRPEDLRP